MMPEVEMLSKKGFYKDYFWKYWTLALYILYIVIPLFQKNPVESKFFLMQLEIKDINDNAPIFANEPYTAAVAEVSQLFICIFSRVTCTNHVIQFNCFNYTKLPNFAYKLFPEISWFCKNKFKHEWCDVQWRQN